MKAYLPKIIGAFINLIGYVSSSHAAKLAINIFSKPRNGRLNDKASEYLQSVDQKNLTHKGALIKTYHWKGDKTTILLVHGWESNAYRWQEFIEYIKPFNYNIHAIDAPAHGNTEGKLFNAILYSEYINIAIKQFKPKVIIGHSVGGMSTVFSISFNQVEHIKKVVLLGAPDGFLDILNQYENIMGYNKHLKKAIKKYIKKKFDHFPEYFSTSNFSKGLKAKGLIVHDKKDRIIPFSDALQIKNKYKNATLIETTGHGHKLKSEIIYQHILDFLEA